MDLYAENVLDHYRHPRNTGTIATPTVTHREENISCGDDLELDLLLEDGIIKEVKWRGQGCAISQAAMSLLSETLTGMTEAEASAVSKERVLELLGVPVGMRRMKCALLCLHTLKNALRVSAKAAPLSWLQNVEIDN